MSREIKEIVDSLRLIAKDGYRVESYDNGILEEAADLIERLQKHISVTSDFEPSMNGLYVVLPGADGIKRKYQAFTSKLGPEIVVMAAAETPEGEVKSRRYGFVDLYSAQMHVIGLNEALVHLIHFAQPYVEEEKP
jgi:hypothetical protein